MKNRNYERDLAATTAYIYHELMEYQMFFADIDKAIDIAETFIKEFPSDINWEQQKNTWEEELYKFYKNW